MFLISTLKLEMCTSVKFVNYLFANKGRLLKSKNHIELTSCQIMLNTTFYAFKLYRPIITTGIKLMLVKVNIRGENCY